MNNDLNDLKIKVNMLFVAVIYLLVMNVLDLLNAVLKGNIKL